MQQNLIAFLPFMMIAAVSVICLVLLWSMGRQSRKFRVEYDALQDCVTAKVTELDAALKKVQQPVVAPAPSAAAEPQEPAANPARTGLNSTNRSKVLKMHRLGQSPEQIAANLRLPRGEVHLLVKIHEVAMKSFNERPAPAWELSTEKS
jgi:hypothetical protein